MAITTIRAPKDQYDAELARTLADSLAEVQRRFRIRETNVERAHEQADYARNHGSEDDLDIARDEVVDAVRRLNQLSDALRAAGVNLDIFSED
jgi:hypothetical protein